MKPNVRRRVSEFTLPGNDWMQSARSSEGDPARHSELLATSPALNSVRVAQANGVPYSGNRMRVAAWNLERCKFMEESAQLLASAKIDVALLSEADIGMCRSGNLDTISDLAQSLRMGHAAGVEFIELGLGDERETEEHVGGVNLGGLHCNAVLSKFRIEDAAVIPLGPGGDWFAGKPGKGQRRVGCRVAVGARIAAAAPLWAFAVHFESEGRPADRAAEAEKLVAGLEAVGANGATVVGGDFNFNGIPPGENEGSGRALKPELHEPAFRVMREAGYEWSMCNAPGPTTRRHPWHNGHKPLKIDWMFIRNVDASNSSIVPAVGLDGGNLSDHEMIQTDIQIR
ncbi:MAG: endonuclease/exonuclease/phosphatase family protein [Rhodobacteraceae bacterium]|nr:endonuclease/exonuclease/phosphatase family protein [Paracoccaceae bacterium]